MATVEAAILTTTATATKCSTTNLSNTHSSAAIASTERISSYSNSTGSAATT
jgi:hypothetical protein